jgi:hypothetical protein
MHTQTHARRHTYIHAYVHTRTMTWHVHSACWHRYLQLAGAPSSHWYDYLCMTHTHRNNTRICTLRFTGSRPSHLTTALPFKTSIVSWCLYEIVLLLLRPDDLHVYMYVCIHVCMYACMRVCICKYIYVCVCVCVCVCLCTHGFTCMNARMCVQVYYHRYVSKCMYVSHVTCDTCMYVSHVTCDTCMYVSHVTCDTCMYVSHVRCCCDKSMAYMLIQNLHFRKIAIGTVTKWCRGSRLFIPKWDRLIEYVRLMVRIQLELWQNGVMIQDYSSLNEIDRLNMWPMVQILWDR